MKDLPTLKQLEYFLALAETGSFKAAAQHCGISQPSLSVQLSALEKRLGQRLVERSKSGVILTPAGREVRDRARGIIDASQGLMHRFHAPLRGLTGTIRFGASGTLGPYLLPHVIARLHALHPDLNLFIREASPSELSKGLATGEFDMILVQLPVSGDVRPIRLFREPLELVVARDHPFVTQTKVSRAQLKDAMLLTLGPAYSLRQTVSELAETLQARLRTDYDGTSLGAVRLMAGMGMGLAFLPALYIRSEIGAEAKDVAVVELEGPRILRSVGLVTRADSLDEVAPRIARLIQAVAREVFSKELVVEHGKS